MIAYADSCSSLTANALARGLGVRYAAQAFGFNAQVQPLVGAQYGYYAFDCDAIYTKIVGYQANYRNGFTLTVKPGNPTGGLTETNIWSWSNGGFCLATVSFTKTGHLNIYLGGDGHTSLGTFMYGSQAVLGVGTYFIDLDWFFPGGSGHGSVSLYINDVLDSLTTGPSVPNAVWGAQPDRFALVTIGPAVVNAGYLISDLVVSNGAGTTNTGRLGPCRVEYVRLQQDQLIQWPTLFPSTDTAFVQAVWESPGFPVPFQTAPDGDVSYIATTTPGDALFGVPSLNCYAAILGVGVGACLRDPSSGSANLVVRPTPSNGMDVTVGPLSPQPAYNTQIAILEQLGGGTITDGAIQNAWWGIANISGTPFATQAFLEKITTRRAVPFQCGQIGNYCV